MFRRTLLLAAKAKKTRKIGITSQRGRVPMYDGKAVAKTTTNRDPATQPATPPAPPFNFFNPFNVDRAPGHEPSAMAAVGGYVLAGMGVVWGSVLVRSIIG
jgi:hypothetical protein